MAENKKRNVTSTARLGILETRRREARLLAHVFDTLKETLGEEEARTVLDQIVRKAAIEQGSELASETQGAPDLEDFLNILPLWTRDDALRLDVLRADKAHLDFNVVRCRYAEMYRDMGLGSLGSILSCSRDGAFCVGYNPDIEFERTQTIMEGASHCDFRYRLKAEDNKGNGND